MGKEGVGGHTAVVRAPDGEIKTFPLSKKDKGEALFCQVTRDLSIEEKEYFSLCFYDREGIRHWLYNDKPIQKQLKDLPWEFSYEVKFYPTQPTSLTDDNARYNLYQQLRREIVTGRLPASIESHAILGGLQVQADIGDVQQSAEYENYLQTTQFSPYPESGLVGKIRDEHVKHKGQTQDEAILGYLETCRQLSMYGVFLFSAKDDKDNAVNIGICATGINIYREQARLHKFAWQHIIKISFRKSNFSIELKPGQLSKKSTTVHYTTPSYYHAKRCWKCGVEHHTFFRLMQPEEKAKPGFFHLGSTRFQYHGRTQFQTKMASQLFDRPGSATVPRSQVPGTRISQSLDNVAAQQAGTHYDVTGTKSTDRQTHSALVQHHARKREVKVSELTSDDELVYLPVESPLSAAYYTYEGVSPASTLASTQRDRGVRFETTPRAACPAESRKRVRRNLFGVSWSPSKKSHDTSAVLLTAHMPATPEEVTNLERSDEIPEIPIGTRSAVYSKGFYEKLSKTEVDLLKTSVHQTNQDDLEKRNEMPGYPIRYFVDVKHSGQFDKYRIARLKHAGSEDELASAKIDYKNYLFPTIEKSSVGRLEKTADVESSHIIEHVQLKKVSEKPKAKKRKLGKRDSVESRSSTDSNSSSKQRSKFESTQSRFLKFLRNISPQRNRETATQSSQYHYITTDRYDGPLQSIPKPVELEESPFRKLAHPKQSSQQRGETKKPGHAVVKVQTQQYRIHGRFFNTGEHETFEEQDKNQRGHAQTMNISAAHSRPKSVLRVEPLARSESAITRGTAVVYLKEVPSENQEEPSESVEHEEKENRKKRDWGFHLPSFKIGGSRRSTKEGEEPYPIVSEPYEGPLDSVDRENDLEKIPLDTTPAQESKTTTITTTRRFFLFGRVRHEGEEEVVEQEHVKPDTYGLATTSYEGPLEELPREDDLGAAPLGEHAAVYHQGDSWLSANEHKKKTKKVKGASPTTPEIEEPKQAAVVYLKEVQGEETHEEAHDEKENRKKRDWGFHLPSFKIGGSRRSTKEGEEPYPIVSEPYQGPLDSVDRENDLERLPFETEPATDKIDTVAAPSGEGVETKRTAVVYLKEVPSENQEEPSESVEHEEKENRKKRDWGFHLPSFKIGGSRRSTKEGEESYRTISEEEKVARSGTKVKSERRARFAKLMYFERFRHEGLEDTVEPTTSYDVPDFDAKDSGLLVHENLPHQALSDAVKLHANYPAYPRKTQRLRIFSRLMHPGEVELIEKEKIDESSYPTQTAIEGDVDVMQRNSEMMFLSLKSSCEAYHEGQYHKLPIVPPFTPTKSYQPQFSAHAATSPIHSLEPLAELESRLFNLQEEINGAETEIVEVRIERRCEIELRPVYTLESKKPRPAGGGVSRGVAERKEIHHTFTTTPPPTEEEDQPSTSATMPSGRNFLQRIGLMKNGTSKEKKKKSKKGKNGTDTSSSSSSSEDEKAVVVVRQSTTTTTANRPAGEMPPQESGQPHTTVQRWQETNILPDQVVTEVDEDGNTVTRTIKTSQVKSTVQKQTFQNFTVPEDENMVSTVERVREQVVPRTSPDKSGKIVETHTRTVAYENGAQPAQEDLGEFVSSKTVTSGNRTVETITYKTEKDGVVETHVEHRVTIHSDDAIDHDAELSKAILEATQMNPDMTVEKIEVKQEATQ